MKRESLPLTLLGGDKRIASLAEHVIMVRENKIQALSIDSIANIDPEA